LVIESIEDTVMSNIIDGNGRLRDVGGPLASKKNGVGRDGARQTESAAASDHDSVADIAIASEKRLAMEARIAQTPNVDMERVARIKTAIARGEYPVDTDRIAEKFVELEGLLDNDA
jgi:negative regulator of flagellin synthesis FlgM